MFATAVFGVVAVLSLPVGRLLQSPLGRILPWSGPLGGILHGALSPPSSPGVRASGPAEPDGGPGSGPFVGTPGTVSGGGSVPGVPVPAPDPRPRPTPQPGSNEGNLKDRISDLDRATLALLDRLVGNRDLRSAMGRLADMSDRPGATATLLALTARDRLAELQSRVTPAQLHMLLRDIRGLLTTLIPRLPADWQDRLIPAGRWFGPSGPAPAMGHGPPTTWSPRHAFGPRSSKHAHAAQSNRHRHHHKR